MNDNKKRFWAWVLVGLFVFGIAIALNIALIPATGQFDLTQDERYTIPPALKRIAARLKEPDRQGEVVRVTVYLSDSLPRYLEHLPRTINTRLSELRRASDGLIEYTFVDPKNDTDLQTELKDKFKIEPMALQDFREGEMTTGAYYLAMLFRYKKDVEALQLRDLGQELVKEERTLAALPGLLATRLLKVMTPAEEVVVGIVSEKKMPQQQQAQPGQKPTDGIDPLRERLKAHVHVKDVVLKGGPPIPPDIKTLLLYKPEGLSPSDVFNLDQFMMRGGNVIVLLLDNFSTFDYDRLSVTDQALQQGKFPLRPVDSGLKDWLASFGIDVLPGVVMDRMNHKMVRAEQVPGTPIPRQELADMPGMINVRESDADKKPTGQLDSGESTLAGIASLAFLLPAPVQVNLEEFRSRQPGGSLNVLVRTSAESWVVKDAGDTVPMFRATPPPREEWGSSVLVARASGTLKSYWSDKEPPPKVGANPNDSRPSDASKITTTSADKPAQLWVIADADFAHEVWQRAFGRNPLDRSMIAAAQGLGNSASMVLNVVDAATLGPELVEIRRQRLIDRSIDDARVKKDRVEIQVLNIALMPAVFVVFGLVWWLFRSLQTFVPSPRQPVMVPREPASPDQPAHAVAETSDSHP